MSDIKIFRISTTSATELRGHSVALEKSSQTVIEKDLFTSPSICFLALENHILAIVL